MLRNWILPIVFAATLAPAIAQTRVLMSAVEVKTGQPVKDLQASQIVITDDKAQREVTDLKPSHETVDVMLLLDTGLAGSLVQPLAYDLIDQLTRQEEMAVVSYDDSAQLLQDFTASRDLLKQSVARVKFGNEPKVLDALTAAIADGFEHATYRRVILLLTAGYEGGSRTPEREVVALARKNGVSIYPIFMAGQMRGLFERLARQTGGATFNLMSMAKDATPLSGKPAPLIFDAVRNPYLATIRGNARLSERMKIEVRRPEKIFLSALPLE